MHTTHNPIPQHFELSYYDSKKTRVCFFVNKRIDSRRWTVRHHTDDVRTLELTWGEEEEELIAIHNVYNPMPSLEPTNSAITALQEALHRWSHMEQIVVGDFNLHHPCWGGTQVRTIDQEAEELIRLMEAHQLELLYPPGMTTYRTKGVETTIDLTLATPLLQENLIICQAAENLDHDSDHVPLETIIARPARNKAIPERWSWERTDKEKLHEVLLRSLPNTTAIRTREDVDRTTRELVSSILTAVGESTPKSRIGPRSIPGWTKECKEAQMQARRLRRKYQRVRTSEAWEAYKRARNHKAKQSGRRCETITERG
jgi:hypothetical protein